MLLRTIRVFIIIMMQVVGGKNYNYYATSISFVKKLPGHFASAVACTLMPHMMAYVSRFIELT